MSTIKTETLSTPSNATVPVDTVVNGTAKAWVNFNGEGTVAIRRAFNVSSITDNGTGRFTVTFTTAMVDTNYSVVGGAGGSVRNNTLANAAFSNDLRTVNSVGIDTQYAHTTAFDPPFVSVAVFS